MCRGHQAMRKKQTPFQKVLDVYKAGEAEHRSYANVVAGGHPPQKGPVERVTSCAKALESSL